MTASDHQPVAPEHIQQVIFKVAQRCNLNCTYCYVYNRGDDSWLNRPSYASERVAEQLGRRIKQQCEVHGDTTFTVELHGGEPLLMGQPRMQKVLDAIVREAGPVDVVFALQTNATLLTYEWLEFFKRNRISFGISLDGPPELADRHRVMRTGGGSTELVLAVLDELRSRGPLLDEVFGGCLCVVDPSYDGAELVKWFVQQGFRRFDLLLPDGNTANLPAGWTGVEPYRRFLFEAFEQWYSMPAPVPQIRLFESMMSGLMGQHQRLDGLGGDLKGLCVVESDGSIGAHDVLRMCGGLFSRDVINIFDDPLDAHAGAYDIDRIQTPCDTCRACPFFSSCGGGYLPHRFDGVGFDNRSLYCGAMYALSERMWEVLEADLPATAWVDDTAILRSV